MTCTRPCPKQPQAWSGDAEPAEGDAKLRYWYVGLHRECRASMPPLSLEQAKLMAPAIWSNLGGLRSRVAVEVWVESDDGAWVGCDTSGTRTADTPPQCLRGEAPAQQLAEDGQMEYFRARHWFAMLRHLRHVVAPRRWVWSDLDIEMNDLLNRHLWKSTSEWVHMGEFVRAEFARVVASPAPPSRDEWVSSRPRVPQWTFPDTSLAISPTRRTT